MSVIHRPAVRRALPPNEAEREARTQRRHILAETLARLEVERFQAPRRPETSTPRPAPITAEQAATNAQLLLDAIGDDPFLADQADRRTA